MKRAHRRRAAREVVEVDKQLPHIHGERRPLAAEHGGRQIHDARAQRGRERGLAHELAQRPEQRGDHLEIQKVRHPSQARERRPEERGPRGGFRPGGVLQDPEIHLADGFQLLRLHRALSLHVEGSGVELSRVSGEGVHGQPLGARGGGGALVAALLLQQLRLLPRVAPRLDPLLGALLLAHLFPAFGAARRVLPRLQLRQQRLVEAQRREQRQRLRRQVAVAAADEVGDKLHDGEGRLAARVRLQDGPQGGQNLTDTRGEMMMMHLTLRCASPTEGKAKLAKRAEQHTLPIPIPHNNPPPRTRGGYTASFDPAHGTSAFSRSL